MRQRKKIPRRGWKGKSQRLTCVCKSEKKKVVPLRYSEPGNGDEEVGRRNIAGKAMHLGCGKDLGCYPKSCGMPLSMVVMCSVLTFVKVTLAFL